MKIVGFVVVFLFALSLSVTCVNSQLNCPKLAPHQPKDISDLHPNDIKVVMAIGDSITAAFGLEGRSGGLDEFRGQSWSVGGDENAVTVANFIKYFNPSLVGYSTGKHLVELCYGVLCPPYQYRPALDILNAAQSGAMISDLVNHEMSFLLAQLKAHSEIDMARDWKLLTILIGANDICASCVGKAFLNPDDFEHHLRELVEKIRTNIPRVLVNVIEGFNLSEVYYLSLKSSTCKTIHRDLFIECDCIFGPGGNKTRDQADTYLQEYNARSRLVAADYKGKYTDFALVVQPFGSNTNVASLPIEFLSTLDCFHPSLIAHQAMAVALWNNMLVPASQKKDHIDINDKPICPTENTLLYIS